MIIKKYSKNKITYRVVGMDCDACAKMIELDLEDAGITASCDYVKEVLEVDEKEDQEKIKEIITKSGYSLAGS